MDDDLFMKRLEELDAILVKSIESSDSRLERVNCMVERIVQQTQTVNEMALKITSLCESRDKLLMDFLSEMRSTYDQHLRELEQSRDRAGNALLMEQQLTAKLIDRISSSGVTISGIGNHKA